MSFRKEQRFRLHPSVFYRNYDDKTVVYLTSEQKVFTFGGSVSDILTRFKEYCSLEEVLQSLDSVYEIDDREDFCASVTDFVGTLAELGIIEAEYQQFEAEDTLESEVENYFSESHELYAVTFELTYRCNERCRHCYISQKDMPEMSTEQIIKVIHDLRNMEVFNLVFTGGELFVRKDTFEILEYAYHEGFVIDIFTNGNLLSGDDIIRLKTIWPRSVHFSLYSHRAEKHDSITQIRGSFEKTLRSVKACKAVGIPVNIKAPVMTETLEDIRGIAELAKSLRVSVELGSNITPKKDGSLLPTKLKIVDADSESMVFDTIRELIPPKREAQKHRKKTDRLCGAGQHSLSINPYGEVFPCIMLPMCIGNVTQSNIEDIWFHSKALSEWRQNNRRIRRIGCENCKFSDDCIFCPGEAMMRTGDPLHKYDEACRSTYAAADREKRKGGLSHAERKREKEHF